MHTKKQNLVLQVVKSSSLNNNHIVLTCACNTTLPKMVPGQFAQVSAGDTAGTFLRRPLSIHNYNETENSVEFLIQIVGNGSSLIASAQPGEYLDVILPLGKGFSLPEKDEKVLLVGGGCGVAPLLFLANEIQHIGAKSDILLGAKNAENLMETEPLSRLGNLFVTTEDGSDGEKGFVTQHPVMAHFEGEYTRIYCCGPEPMMKAVAAIAQSNNTNCEVSLENTMACGIGACLCCVTETVRGNECVCTEGPVFNSKELKWQI